MWLLTGTGVLKAFDFAGKELWARELQKDYGAWGLNHGYGSSPLLDGGALYVQVLHGMNTDDPSYVLKIDGKTGKTLWKVERPTTAQRESPDSYTTPVPVKLGKAMEIVVSGGDIVTGHDPATGKELWRLNGQNPENNPYYRVVASPVVSGDLVFAPSRVKPLTAVRAGGRGDVSASHKLWAFDKGPDVPSPLTDGTLLYLVDDRGRRARARQQDRRRRLRAAAAQAGHLQLVADSRGRPHLRAERGRPHHGHQVGPRVPGAGREPARRVRARLAGGLGRPALHPHRPASVLHRQARRGARELTGRVGSGRSSPPAGPGPAVHEVLAYHPAGKRVHPPHVAARHDRRAAEGRRLIIKLLSIAVRRAR